MRETDAASEATYMKDRPLPEDFAERKAMLATQAGEFAKSKDEATGLAFLSAAQAMIQGRQAPLQALVAGLAVGGKEYGAALKDIKKAEKERQTAEVALAEAQRAAQRGDFETAQARKDKAQDHQRQFEIASTGAVAAAMGQDRTAAHSRRDLDRSWEPDDILARQRSVSSDERAWTHH